MIEYQSTPDNSNSCCFYFIHPNIHFFSICVFWLLVFIKSCRFIICLLRKIEKKHFIFLINTKKLRFLKFINDFFWWIFLLWKFTEKSYDLYSYIMKNDLFYIISVFVLTQKLLNICLNFLQVKNIVIKLFKIVSFKSNTQISINQINKICLQKEKREKIKQTVENVKQLESMSLIDDADFQEISLIDDLSIQEKQHRRGDIKII
jgi:hypothetical protein